MRKHRDPKVQEMIDAGNRAREQDPRRQADLRRQYEMEKNRRYEFTNEQLHRIIDHLLSDLSIAVDSIDESDLMMRINHTLVQCEEYGFFE